MNLTKERDSLATTVTNLNREMAKVKLILLSSFGFVILCVCFCKEETTNPCVFSLSVGDLQEAIGSIPE